MTIEDQSHADERELDLFLQGKGVVSRGLQAIDQPKSSAALEATIFAAIEAELDKEARALPQAANDPTGPAETKPIRRRFSPLWNIPLGLAAGVLLTVMMQKLRHNDDSSTQSVQTTTSNKAIVQGPRAEHESPAAVSTSLAQNQSGKQPAPHIPQLALSTPRAQPSPTTVIESATIQRVEITGSNIKRADVETPSPVQVITAKDIRKSRVTEVRNFLESIPRAQATPCAPNAEWEDRPQAAAWPITPTSMAEDPVQAKACLDLIAEKLGDDANLEALEEWTKFRKTYPDYSAPDVITSKIRELEKTQK